MACDPYFSDVVVLLHCDGVNGGATFVDSSSYARTITPFNAAVTNTAQKKFGTASLDVTVSPSRLSWALAAEINLTTVHVWTVDGWLYSPTGAPITGVFNQASGTSITPLLFDVPSSQLRIQGSDPGFGGAYSILSPNPIPNDQWVHFAAVRDGDDFYLFMNGVLQGTGTYSGDLAELSGPSKFGGEFGSGGYFDEFRITVGVARWTANFTPPTSPDDGACVTVPDVVGESLTDATTDIIGAGLVVGVVSYAYDGAVPIDDVISQSPVGGSGAAPGDSVDLLVSLGPADVTVPDVVGETLTDATADLATAGLIIGTVTGVPDPSPADTVLAQDPIGGATAALGSAVDITVSLGPVVTVPDVVGLTQTDATAAIVGAFLVVGTIGTAYSDSTPINSVVSQSPLPGSFLDPGDPVSFVLSIGPTPVTVPNVVTYPLATAVAILESVGLTLGATSEANSEEIEAGAVISQAPFAGSTVVPGTAVALVLSIGPAAVVVPDVVGMTSSDAANALAAVFLRLGVITVDTSGTFPLGTIAAQDANAGALVPSGTKINLVLSAIAPPFNVDATVISQYAQSPTIVELVESMAAYIDPRANLTLFYSYVWNVDTAQGFGLDVWGRIVGIGRLLRITGDDPTFGFWNESVPDDWQPWSQGRFARGGEDGEAVILDDSAYRILILVKALANITATSAASINALLRNLFPGRGKAYVEDLGGMAMRFVFDFQLTPVEYAIVSQSGALPHPAGVSFSVVMPP